MGFTFSGQGRGGCPGWGWGGGCDTIDTLLAEGGFWSLKPVLMLSSALHRPTPTPPGISRGPSPVVLGSQDALPVATVFTEYVHAYFRGHSPRYAVPGRVRTVRGNGAPWGLCLGSSRDSLQVGLVTSFPTEGP